MSIIITTVPFGEIDAKPTDLMKAEKLSFEINPLGRKLRPEEVSKIIGTARIVIAGTEPITAQVMDQCPNLKAICRVGVGLDSVDLLAARTRGIAISYTPDGPSPAVAELSIGLMIDLLRGVSKADRDIRKGRWHRAAGRRLSECKVGIIGCGRIGGRVIRHLARGFPGVEILANDLNEICELNAFVTWVDRQQIFSKCDVISLHVPLTADTQNLITYSDLKNFKKNALLVNTARGGIVNEHDLAKALKSKIIEAAAMDVYEEEPYNGELQKLDNCLLTCHLGSMTADCRLQMEIEATREAIRFSQGLAFDSPVPEEEYEMAAHLKENGHSTD